MSGVVDTMGYPAQAGQSCLFRPVGHGSLSLVSLSLPLSQTGLPLLWAPPEVALTGYALQLAVLACGMALGHILNTQYLLLV